LCWLWTRPRADERPTVKNVVSQTETLPKKITIK
jgi:hypothetical protein